MSRNGERSARRAARPYLRRPGHNARRSAVAERCSSRYTSCAASRTLALAHGFGSFGAALRPWLHVVLDELVREGGGEETLVLVLLLMVVAILGVYTLYRDDA